MFAKYQTDDELPHPAAGISRMLRAAGCDTTNESDLQRGALAYNIALLVCKYAARNTAVQPVQKSRAGRNEPCPCGSSKKYKKCCLDTDRAPLADHDRSASVKFGPEVLPRLWDEDAVFEDCTLLSLIMDRDRAFANVGFSPEKVASFMDAVFEEEPSLLGNTSESDVEARSRAIDDLAIRYIRESGDSKVTRGIKDKLLAAAKRVQSKDEARALATGIYFAMMADTTNDPADDLIGITLFRKALFDAAAPRNIVSKIFGKLGKDENELRRLIEANDPVITEKINSVMGELDASELDALQASFDRRHRNLWDTIEAGKFPVPMPCATQIALVGRLVAAARNEACSQDDMSAALGAFAEELIEDDYALYGQMLDHWLEDHKGQPDRIIDAVQAMRELCAIRSIEDFVPVLLILSLRTKQMIPFDEEERNFIDGHRERDRNQEFIAKYSSWLRTKGYPGMADRLLLSWENSATPPAEQQPKSNAA
jgi:hypothetical protein